MLQILAFLVVAIAIIVFGLSRMLYGNVTTAELSNKLHGRDWKVESSTAFPLRTNCHVELYSDAHQGEDAPPAIINEDGEKIAYTPGNCWEDVFEAINEAERFIYITGWSVDTTKTLLRTTRKNPEEEEETIGELLTRKAEEGCRVLIHIWDEKMSVAAGGTVQHSGLMCTHDEDTKIFFADSPVEVQLSYRFGELKDHSLVFTHHQKTIIVDAPLFKNEEEAKHKAHEQIAEAKKHLKEKRARRKVEMLRRKQERERRKELRKARRRAGEHVKEEESDEDKKEAEDCSVELQGKGKGKGKGRGRKGGKGRGRGKGKGGKRGGGRRGRKHDDDEEEENNEKEEEEDDGESDGDSEEEEGSGEESEEDEGKDQDRSLDFEFKSERDEAAADGAEAPRLVSFLKEGESMLEHAAEKAHLLPSSTWAGGDRRRVIAFVGGLDICDGRWDTAKHSLFRTLKYEHANDFHNPWPVSHACGPREPWHDIHSKVEGPVAHDILENFVQRWRRQASERKRTRLLDTSPENGFLSTEEDKGNYKSLTESWNVQLFRSVDKFSATIEGIDASIQEAYINTIRTSTRFIYMENQYFLGSCQYWDTNKDAGCVNLIPYELAKRICEFIHKKEQYNVYIVIPMYPEGIPADGAIQEILRWQHYTMRMMYKMVAKAIAEVYGDEPERPVPTDYLNFYCLGKREGFANSEAQVLDPAVMPEATPDDIRLHTTRRFSIYVHSKLLIADDVYAIVGSANINDRSLAGWRDSEIAVGCYQPSYGITSNGGGRGQVHKFRMFLFSEHLNLSSPIMVNPNTIECARYVNELANKNWDTYCQEETVDMDSHLMHYPINIEPTTGAIATKVANFPDTEAKIKGTKSTLLLDKLTT